MKINIELSIDKPENFIIFKITDTVREFVYNYIYSLANVSNINTLCTFLHNGKEIIIRKSQDNYLIINNNIIEIKTENSSVKQMGEIDIKKLHNDLAKILYANDYIELRMYFSPSKYVLDNYKIKKSNISEQQIREQLEKLNNSKLSKIDNNINISITSQIQLRSPGTPVSEVDMNKSEIMQNSHLTENTMMDDSDDIKSENKININTFVNYNVNESLNVPNDDLNNQDCEKSESDSFKSINSYKITESQLDIAANNWNSFTIDQNTSNSQINDKDLNNSVDQNTLVDSMVNEYF